MPRYANVDRLMGHAIKMDWSMLKWVNEVDIYDAINPNVVERAEYDKVKRERDTAINQLLSINKGLGAEMDDVVVQKKGKWIKRSDTDDIYWSCSECGEDIPRVSHFDPQFDLFPRLESIEKTNFCPNCGADMREESDNGIH